MAKQKFSVDIQFTKEITYQVEAENPDEAEEIAMQMYAESEEPDHSEIVVGGAVVNTTEV